jgi:hypothetical protein
VRGNAPYFLDYCSGFWQQQLKHFDFKATGKAVSQDRNYGRKIITDRADYSY